jgi:hypothetical protein
VSFGGLWPVEAAATNAARAMRISAPGFRQTSLPVAAVGFGQWGGVVGPVSGKDGSNRHWWASVMETWCSTRQHAVVPQ